MYCQLLTPHQPPLILVAPRSTPLGLLSLVVGASEPMLMLRLVGQLLGATLQLLRPWLLARVPVCWLLVLRMHLMMPVLQQITLQELVMSFRLSTRLLRSLDRAALPSMLPELPLLEELMLLTLLLPRCVSDLATQQLLRP